MSRWLVGYETAASLFSKLEQAKFYPNEDTRRAAEKLEACDLLILDDLGTEMPGQFTVAALYGLLNARLMARKPMIITTNLTMQELENPDSREKMRIYDRVLECCTPVRVDGAHIRGAKRSENRAFAREHLK